MAVIKLEANKLVDSIANVQLDNCHLASNQLAMGPLDSAVFKYLEISSK